MLRELNIYTALCKHAERVIYLCSIMQTCCERCIMSELEREYRSLYKKRWKLFCMYLVVRSQPDCFKVILEIKGPGSIPDSTR